MAEIYLTTKDGQDVKMELSAEQERAVYAVLGLQVGNGLGYQRYSDKTVMMITDAIARMLHNNAVQASQRACERA